MSTATAPQTSPLPPTLRTVPGPIFRKEIVPVPADGEMKGRYEAKLDGQPIGSFTSKAKAQAALDEMAWRQLRAGLKPAVVAATDLPIAAADLRAAALRLVGIWTEDRLLRALEKLLMGGWTRTTETQTDGRTTTTHRFPSSRPGVKAHPVVDGACYCDASVGGQLCWHAAADDIITEAVHPQYEARAAQTADVCLSAAETRWALGLLVHCGREAVVTLRYTNEDHRCVLRCGDHAVRIIASGWGDATITVALQSITDCFAQLEAPETDAQVMFQMRGNYLTFFTTTAEVTFPAVPPVAAASDAAA